MSQVWLQVVAAAVVFTWTLVGLRSEAAAEPLPLSGSAGKAGANKPEDVKRVQQRLRDLGFDWITPDGISGAETIHAIQLFQAIKNGDQTVDVPHNDGRVDVGGDAHRWLEASNAPRWGKMSASGDGYENIEIPDASDDHDYGTSWLDDTIQAAAKQYKTDYLCSHQASLVTVNDCSRNKGVDSPDHQGHETGLSVDLRLPKKGHSGASPGGLTIQSADYDRDAARAILKAFRAQPLCNPDRLFFSDPTLVAEGLCKSLAGHDNHIHLEIKPPKRNP